MNRCQLLRTRRVPGLRTAALLLAATTLLSGCEALFVGGAMMGTGLVVIDRRTTGAQVEDEAISLKAASRIRDLTTLGRVNVTSYNRLALITGDVPSEPDKAAVAKAVAGVENIKGVVNELHVGENASLGQRSSDTLLSAKVKASFVDAKDLQVHAIRVVTERGVVYLMGRVTEREANRAADVARGVGGVQKVVKVFELISEEELAKLGQTAAAK